MGGKGHAGGGAHNSNAKNKDTDTGSSRPAALRLHVVLDAGDYSRNEFSLKALKAENLGSHGELEVGQALPALHGRCPPCSLGGAAAYCATHPFRVIRMEWGLSRLCERFLSALLLVFVAAVLCYRCHYVLFCSCIVAAIVFGRCCIAVVVLCCC